MYDNIGRKLKGLAKALFAIEAIIFGICGLVLISADNDFAVLGFLVIILGFLVSWISSWFLFGFGELIESNCEIAQHMRNNDFCPQSMPQHRNVSHQSNPTQNGEIEPNDFDQTQPINQNDNQRIQELINLRSQGLITEAEFDLAIGKK